LDAKSAYGPFGELLRATGLMAKANPFRFSTKYQDDESDLLYYGRRYLPTITGRWLSRDPIGKRAGWNMYVFVRNEPIADYDPIGLEIVPESPPKNPPHHHLLLLLLLNSKLTLSDSKPVL
jgi:RHS repeat-associated protein